MSTMFPWWAAPAWLAVLAARAVTAPVRKVKKAIARKRERKRDG